MAVAATTTDAAAVVAAEVDTGVVTTIAVAIPAAEVVAAAAAVVVSGRSSSSLLVCRSRTYPESVFGSIWRGEVKANVSRASYKRRKGIQGGGDCAVKTLSKISFAPSVCFPKHSISFLRQASYPEFVHSSSQPLS